MPQTARCSAISPLASPQNRRRAARHSAGLRCALRLWTARQRLARWTKAHLHQALLQDADDLRFVQGVLQAVTDEDHERQALAKLVRAGGRARGLQGKSTAPVSGGGAESGGPRRAAASRVGTPGAMGRTKVPAILSSIQCFGALTRFRCFLGPRGMLCVRGLGGGWEGRGRMRRRQRARTPEPKTSPAKRRSPRTIPGRKNPFFI